MDIKTEKDGESSRKKERKMSQDTASWLPVTLKSIEKTGEMGEAVSEPGSLLM